MAFNYSPKIVTDGLILYLDAANTKSYPGSGTVWTDLSRSGNNGTLTNGPTFNNENGGSIVFDGSNDYVVIPGNTEPFSSLTVYSIGLWLKASYTGNKVIIEKGANVKMMFQPDTTTSRLFYGDLKAYSTTVSNILNGTWNYYSIIQDSTNAKFYVNGVLLNTSSAGNVAANSSNIVLMSRSGLFAQSGNISLLKIYNRVLTATEILQNYNSTKSRFNLI